MHLKLLNIAIFGLMSALVYAEDSSMLNAEKTVSETAQDTWVDHAHDVVSKRVDRTADRIDNWFGQPDPNHPASATLRILLDTHWNKDDGITFKPRVRGRVRLPTLQNKISVMFGDESLDDEVNEGNHVDKGRYVRNPNRKRVDTSQSRDENASLALRWSNFTDNLGMNTDVDVGIRSGSDLYLRLKADRSWQHTDALSSRIEQMYRYGRKSKHYARTLYQLRHQSDAQTFVMNELAAHYHHKNSDDKGWEWDNNLYRQHDMSGNRRLNYGIYAGGSLDNRGHKLNTYGPFIGWRQPVFREWLFVQGELNYYNNRNEDRNHRVGAFFRVEALF